tara:strand:+ start:57 stop:404 length:348 start_codon:yes stop_codon:yes gene_type:complete
MNTQENNKMIAEFMGWDIKIPTTIPPNLHLSNLELDNGDIMELKFHKSWNWLMPIVDKIESLSIVSFEKNLQEEGDYQCLFTQGNDIVICHYADTSREATYKAVVEFINEYNKTK